MPEKSAARGMFLFSKGAQGFDISPDLNNDNVFVFLSEEAGFGSGPRRFSAAFYPGERSITEQ